MYDYLVSEYLKKLTIEDIIRYGLENNVIVSNHDAEIILNYAKKYYKVFIHDDPTEILKELKKKIDFETYKEIYRLYIINKTKYL